MPTNFEDALNGLPRCISALVGQHKTVSKLCRLVTHEIDLYHEGEGAGIRNKRDLNTCLRFLASWEDLAADADAEDLEEKERLKRQMEQKKLRLKRQREQQKLRRQHEVTHQREREQQVRRLLKKRKKRPSAGKRWWPGKPLQGGLPGLGKHHR